MNENITFEIHFLSSWWDKPPLVEILIDSHQVHHAALSNGPQVIAVRSSCDFDHPHRLSIRRYNKTDDQCIVADGQIIKDQWTIIERVFIDGIDIKNLIEDRSWYEPDYSTAWQAEQLQKGVEIESKIKGELWLSHNGIWHFDFTSPFYKFVISQFR